MNCCFLVTSDTLDAQLIRFLLEVSVFRLRLSTVKKSHSCMPLLSITVRKIMMKNYGREIRTGKISAPPAGGLVNNREEYICNKQLLV